MKQSTQTLQETKRKVVFPYSGSIQSFDLVTSEYANGGLAVQLWTRGKYPQPFATLSVWFPESPALPFNCFYLKEWSENTAIAAALIQAGEIIPEANPRWIESGFVTARVARLSMAAMMKGNTP